MDTLPPLVAESAPERLILELGASLHRYGTPAHRLEQILGAVAARLGVEVALFAVPTAIIAAFGPVGAQRGGLVRLEPGEPDLGKQSRLDDVVRELLTGGLSVEAATAAVRRVADASPPRWAPAARLAAYALASAAGAVFFGGGGAEVVAAGGIGLGLGALAALLVGGRARHLFVPLAATLAALGATIAAALVAPFRVDIAILAGLLILLPGLSLTVALTELSTRHLVSGTARLVGATLVLLELAFGVALGGRLGAWVATGRAPPATTAPAWATTAPAWATPLAVLVASLAFAALFRARGRDLPAIVAAGAVAAAASRLGAGALGPELGALVAASALTAACNLYARIWDRPPSVPLVPALLLLVPGSLGLRSASWLVADEALRAVDAASDMALVGVSLAVGVVAANAVLPPRRSG